MTAPARARGRCLGDGSCRRCGEPMTPQKAPVPGMAVASGRGLCSSCHDRSSRDGTLLDYPRLTRRLVDTAEDFRELVEADPSTTREAIAERLGMSVESLDRALYRAGVDVTVVAKRRTSPPWAQPGADNWMRTAGRGMGRSAPGVRRRVGGARRFGQ